MAKSLIAIGSALLATGAAYADIVFEPTTVPGDVSFNTVFVAGTEYHQISVEDFPLPMDGVQNAGLPSVPYTAPIFLLPPDIQVDSIETVSVGTSYSIQGSVRQRGVSRTTHSGFSTST